jgi:hypothetical protein
VAGDAGCGDDRADQVRKVLRSGATSFEYMRVMQPRPKLGSWHVNLDRMLLDNEAKPTRERLTLIRILEELRGLGYEGSYSTGLGEDLQKRSSRAGWSE